MPGEQKAGTREQGTCGCCSRNASRYRREESRQQPRRTGGRGRRAAVTGPPLLPGGGDRESHSPGVALDGEGVGAAARRGGRLGGRAMSKRVISLIQRQDERLTDA